MAATSPVLETALLTTREFIAPGFWCLGFRAPNIGAAARPAQFVAIDVPGEFTVRLPLGIWTARDGEVSFLFREWGERTRRLAHLAVGTELSFIGPLGNEFELPKDGRHALIAAGGLGIAPFWLLTKSLLSAGVRTSVVVGARTKDLIVGTQALESLGLRVNVCTDDGSAGARGTVVDAVRKVANAKSTIYGCGPRPMLKALSECAAAAGAQCQVSMEETFGCSMGTCWGCVIPVRRGTPQGTRYPKAAAEPRDYDFARVCIDGTVFNAAEVVWAN